MVNAFKDSMLSELNNISVNINVMEVDFVKQQF